MATEENLCTYESVEIRHADQLIIRMLNFCIINNVSVCRYSLEQTGQIVELKCHYERLENPNSSGIIRIIREIMTLQNQLPARK